MMFRIAFLKFKVQKSVQSSFVATPRRLVLLEYDVDTQLSLENLLPMDEMVNSMS